MPRKPHESKNLKPLKPVPAEPKTSKYTVEEPDELLKFLIKMMPSRGRNAVKSILARGQVEVNGQSTTKHNEPIGPGQTITIHWVKPASTKLEGLRILFEDDDLLVVDKREGLLTIASDKEKQETAYRQLTDYVRAVNPANRIFIVHRLDKDTSGVLLFAKNEEVKNKLQNGWKEIVSERTYIALVQGKVKQLSGVISSWLKETRTHLVYSSPSPNGGQKAITHFAVLESNSQFSMLQVNLETGRKNQIRVHMKDIGHPVVGDKKYGAKGNPIGRLGLHAHVLAFKHPVDGQLLRFESPIPKKFYQVFKTRG